MNDCKFTKDIKNRKDLRTSFNTLAMDTFGINFEDWYEKGFWTEKYEPFCFLDGDKVVANVSANKMKLYIGGKLRNGIQIGTVMTHPDYRNKGLSARLINRVLEEYKDKADIIYLFANSSVLNFYPKFGFKRAEEHFFYIHFVPKYNVAEDGIRQLDGTNASELQFIYHFASERVPVSKRFGSVNTQELLLFYCLYVFNQNIYYLEKDDVIVIYRMENNELHIFDIVSKATVKLESILHKIAPPNTNKVVFHFTPEFHKDLKRDVFHGSEVLFVKTEVSLPNLFKHPLTSQA